MPDVVPECIEEQSEADLKPTEKSDPHVQKTTDTTEAPKADLGSSIESCASQVTLHPSAASKP